jgi:hypothetical protein
MDAELFEKMAKLSNNSLIANVIGNFFSVIAGGLVTLFITKYTLKRQFDYEQKTLKENELEVRKKSLLIVMHELGDNHVLIKTLLSYFDEAGVKNEPASIAKFKYTFSYHGWEQYKYEIIPISEEENLLVLIDYLYMQIRAIDSTKTCMRGQLNDYLRNSDIITAKIRELIDTIKIS